ncbi:MAG: hypothetical protein IJW49_00325 [Clostridia bacterium]|nr:hypothetical protein [Clostridia bacterium]
MKQSIKRLSLLLALLMILASFSSVLVGCSGNKDSDGTTESKKAPDATTPGDDSTSSTPDDDGTSTSGDDSTSTPDDDTTSTPDDSTTNPDEDLPDPPAVKTESYTVSIQSAGGLKLSGISVNVISKSDGRPVILNPGTTNESGLVSFELPTTEEYYVVLAAVPAGYSYNTEGYTFNADRISNITLTSSVIKPSGDVYHQFSDNEYVLGSVVHDFKFTDSDGEEHILSEILEDKKAVMLNFWYTTCSWCVEEFPAIEQAYLEYYDDVEILALDTLGDANTDIASFKNTYGLSFPMGAFDENAYYAYGASGYPTTVMIDRYGVVCMINSGAILGDNAFQNLFSHFAADEYEQKLLTSAADLSPQEKPNVEMPTSEELNAALGTSDLVFYPEQLEELSEYSWPFIITEFDGQTCIKPSNSGKNYSYAFLHVDVPLEAGQAIVFEYYASSEYNADILSMRINGEDIYQISGNFGTGWGSCCTYVANRAGTYTLTFMFLKDTTTHEGEDAVFVKNLRIVSEDEIDVPTYIPRDAATDQNADGDGYLTYPELFFNELDGYYHVGSETGPILLANLLSPTLFNDGEYSINDYAILGQLYYDYLETVANRDDAQTYYAEAVSGGFRFYRIVNGEKQYLEMYWYSAISQVGFKYVDEASAKCVYAYNTEKDSWSATINNVVYYLGASREFNIVTASRMAPDFPLTLLDSEGIATATPSSDTAYYLGLNQITLGEYRYLNGEIKDLDTVLTEYLIDASNATVNGLCSVNEELKQLLMKVAELLGMDGSETSDLQWLQICRYYDAYATEQFSDPIKGLSFHSAFEAVENEPNLVYYDGRLIMPRGLFYKFVPTVSGVYHIVSQSDSSVDGWIFTENTTDFPYLTYEKLERTWEDYNNNSIYLYMEAGKAYYVNLAYSDYYQSGSFTFTIQNVGETFEVFRYCSNGFFTSSSEEVMDEYSLITGGLMKIVYDAEEDRFYQYYGDDTNNRNPKPIYADFTNLTPLFSHSIESMIAIGGFDFSKNADDEIVLNYISLYPDTYEEELQLYYGENYEQEFVDEVVAGVYHGLMVDYTKTDKDVTILEYIELYPSNYEDKLKTLWGDAYDQSYVDDVVAGIYHGNLTDYARGQVTAGVDYTEIMQAYLESEDMILNSEDAPEMNGCIAADMQLAMILQHLVDKYSFSGVTNAWSKLCCFWEQHGAGIPMTE